jgi:hypothetical protein
MLEKHERAIRPTLAGIVLICFLLPFLKITCAGQSIASVSGVDLVMGKKLDASSMFGEQGGFSNQSSQQSSDNMPFVITNPETGETLNTTNDNIASTQPSDDFGSDTGTGNIDPNPIAMVALACAVVALFASFGPTRKGMLTSTICAGLTAVLLFVLKSTLMSEMPSEMMGVLEVNWVHGFWVALCGSAVLAGITGKVMSGTSPNSRPKQRVVIQSYSTESTPSTPIKH